MFLIFVSHHVVPQAFGLSEPGVRHWHSEPPQYMLDLYNEVADANGLTRIPGPYGATIVRSFSEKGRLLLHSFFLSEIYLKTAITCVLHSKQCCAVCRVCRYKYFIFKQMKEKKTFFPSLSRA